MALEKPTENKALAPEQVATKLVDPNTGIEVVPVPDGFDAHLEERGLTGPCKDC